MTLLNPTRKHTFHPVHSAQQALRKEEGVK